MKKLFSLLLTAALLCGLYAVPAFAAPEAAPCPSRPCEKCQQGQLYLDSTANGAWYVLYYVPCAYGKEQYNDCIQERACIDTYICDACGLGEALTRMETRQVHDHPSHR